MKKALITGVTGQDGSYYLIIFMHREIYETYPEREEIRWINRK